MYYLFFVIHVLVCLLLCVVVLLQQSKGGGLAGAFGGAGAGEAMFGARGVTTFLHKATIYLAVAFMVTSLGLVFLSAGRGRGVESSLSSQAAARRAPVSTAPAPVPTELPEGEMDVVPTAEAEGDDVVPEAEPTANGEAGTDAGETAGDTESQGGSR